MQRIIHRMQTIFPILRYEDARGAIKMLCEQFGFVELFSLPETGPIVRHAQLKLGSNVIMVGSTRSEDGIVSPKIAGVSTQALSVYIEDIDTHYLRAKSAKADITSLLQDTDFGAREYHARDAEGHQWTFGTFLPSVDRK